MHLQCDTSHPQLKRSASGESHDSRTSAVSAASSNRTLLFGEIPSPTSPLSANLTSASRSNGSVCNLVMSTSPSFQRFWMNEKIRDNFLAHLPQQDLCNIRLVCHDLGARAAPFLFDDITINFNTRTFTKPARIRALDKIGRHVRTLTFKMPHSDQTFLPPIIDPMTGVEEPFQYEPQIQSNPKEPRYGSWEMTELLVRQYPPLFHAATNVPSFVRAFSAMPSLQHLKISCPGQEPFYRYRRDTVDYALISLRIAIERATLKDLDTLSFLPIHSAGLLYLQPGLGFGATPSSSKLWSQIRNLTIHMDSVSFDRATQTDHLRILHSYLRTFSPHLHRLLFRWCDSRGPSPFNLDREPCMDRPSTGNQAPSSATNGKPATPLKPLKFPHLQHMELENALMDATQIAAFIHRHRRALAEFSFEDVHLRTGTWDDALAPLSRIAGSEEWKNRQVEVMDVPVMFPRPMSVAPPPKHRHVEEPRVMGTLAEQEERSKSGALLGRLLSRSSSKQHSPLAKGGRAKESGWTGAEHVRKFLRSGAFAWR